MRFDVISIFPGFFPGPLGDGIIARASDKGLLDLRSHDLRAYADPPHYQVDDEPFGGGGGMVLKPEPLFDAVEDVHEQVEAAGICPGPVVLLSPQGERFDQQGAERLAAQTQVTLICGRYEGVDERVRLHLVDFELSIGDYVLTGGELAAMVVIEAVTRLMPEALGDADAAQHDSFSESLLDFPQYTRPAVYRGVPVPEVLRSGNHQAIAEWRRQQALLATATKRPDLLEARDLSEEEREWLARASSSELAVSSEGESIQRAGTSKPENERSPAVAASADEAQE